MQIKKTFTKAEMNAMIEAMKPIIAKNSHYNQMANLLACAECFKLGKKRMRRLINLQNDYIDKVSEWVADETAEGRIRDFCKRMDLNYDDFMSDDYDKVCVRIKEMQTTVAEKERVVQGAVTFMDCLKMKELDKEIYGEWKK